MIAPEFIALTFGPSFAPAASALRILLVSVVLLTLYQMCQPLLFSRGRPLPIAVPSLGACSIALVVALLAVPALGVSGAILSNLAGFASLVVLALTFSIREIRRPAPAQPETSS